MCVFRIPPLAREQARQAVSSIVVPIREVSQNTIVDDPNKLEGDTEDMDDNLVNLIVPVTGHNDQLTVKELIQILETFPKDAVVFTADTERDRDVPLRESNIDISDDETEVYIDVDM